MKYQTWAFRCTFLIFGLALSWVACADFPDDGAKYAFRDPSGNIVLVTESKSGDGDLWYCTKSNCTYMNSSPYQTADGKQKGFVFPVSETGTASLQIDPKKGTYAAKCGGDDQQLPMKILSKADAQALLDKVRSHEIKFTFEKRRSKYAFYALPDKQGYIWMDSSAGDSGVRFFIGQPGKMKPVNVTKIEDVGFSDTTIVHTALGKDFQFVDSDTALWGEPGKGVTVTAVGKNPKPEDLKIPGVPYSGNYPSPCSSTSQKNLPDSSDGHAIK